ncbi:alpha/beta fold hydrolase [Lyngbya aestuarii]|uniref:alpha/beta fold hydrolase n=1 Tax=Lyngbya aestuarii TaxID=118322 RepID=UPI00403DB31A
MNSTPALDQSSFGLVARHLEGRDSEGKLRIWDFRVGRISTSLGIALLNLGVLLTPAWITTPAQGAEKVYVNFGPLEFSLSIAALEVYATEGKIEPELDFYANYVDPQQLDQLRQALITPVDVTPVTIAQFLYSPQGEVILERVGQVIETKAGQPGFYAIRAALIKAAAYPQGLTLLNVLREFPTYGIRINSGRAFDIIDELSSLIRQTENAIAAVERESRSQASIYQSASKSVMRPILAIAEDPTGFSELPDLRQAGSVSYSKQTMTLNDTARGRKFNADLYLPERPNSLLGEARRNLAPVVVISHGLGSNRQTFAYLAKHLASYGFAVAVPEHPGSNSEQVKALFNGLASEVTPPTELINRPADIKFLLDQLERSFGEQLNLKQVGVLGQSFGGYTALALAGAAINFEQLQQDCASLNNSFNLSLLLQCIALRLPPLDHQLSDERVKSIIAINPIDSTVFGKTQLSEIAMPVMLVAGSDDTVAPALPEQIQPFTWLTTPEKYLVLLKKGTHFSTLTEESGAIPLPPEAIGPDPRIAQEYMKALSLAFFQTYIAGEPEYESYLNASYAQFLSQEPIPLSLLESLTPKQLLEAPN